jgi:riboflavin synthase
MHINITDREYNELCNLCEKLPFLIIEKGSICMNGTSLTAFNITDRTFSVGIIPYTYNFTNINELNRNTVVNLEFDLVGKYVANL